MYETIHRVAVWPASIRLLHLLMAASVLILCLTGSLLYSGLILSDMLYWHLLDVWHVPAGHVLLMTLVVRLTLLAVRRDVAGWKALIPESLEGVVATAVFYISLARMNLPGYFAHNPLWKILYLLMFALLLTQSFTGLMLQSSWLQSVFRTDSFNTLHNHQLLFTPILVIVVAHVITAILHDWKSPSAEISAMINGSKFFTVESEKKIDTEKTSVSISLDSLTGKK